jgi:hypothetical protein
VFQCSHVFACLETSSSIFYLSIYIMHKVKWIYFCGWKSIDRWRLATAPKCQMVRSLNGPKMAVKLLSLIGVDHEGMLLKTQGLVRPERLCKLKKIAYLIGSGTRDLPASSIVAQLLLYRDPKSPYRRYCAHRPCCRNDCNSEHGLHVGRYEMWRSLGQDALLSAITGWVGLWRGITTSIFREEE